MSRTTYAFTTACLVAFLLAAPVQALHCNGEILTIPVGSETLYIDDRSEEVDESDHWIYLESNGIDGLQSGGDANVIHGCGSSLLHPCLRTDYCDHANHDRLIF